MFPKTTRFAVRPSRYRAGFSLIEVTMAIGIVAFAFVALLGLIPTGLNTFREAIDKSNETWIMQNLNSMVQVTEWSQIDALDFSNSGEIYYYDEEGRLTDTETKPASDEAVKFRRLYGAKLLIEKLEQPGLEAGDELRPGRRVIAVIANVAQPPAMQVFNSITGPTEIANIPPGVDIRTRAFIAAQMASDYSGK